jgi:hypothetical protein
MRGSMMLVVAVLLPEDAGFLQLESLLDLVFAKKSSPLHVAIALE